MLGPLPLGGGRLGGTASNQARRRLLVGSVVLCFWPLAVGDVGHSTGSPLVVHKDVKYRFLERIQLAFRSCTVGDLLPCLHREADIAINFQTFVYKSLQRRRES